MVDYDLMAERLAGLEGATRYKRLGGGILLLSVVALACLLALPVYQGDEASLTYFDLAAEPDEDPFAIDNQAVLAQANLAIAGILLTLLMGAILLLEGMRVINLRRYLAWHAEARATFLYSISATVALLGLAGSLAVWGFALSMPTASAPGVNVELEASSPAGAAASVAMALATLAMVAMAYYSSVLSVHRGGGKPRNRQMARLSMLVVALSLLALAALRLGVIMTATLEIAILDGSGDSVELVQYFTHGRIDYLGSEGDVDGMRSLDMFLGSTEVFLALAALAGMGGMVGVSAYSLGGTGRRVRLATSLPATAALLGGIAIVCGALALGSMDGAVEDLMGMEMDAVSSGASMVLGLVASVLIMLLAFLHSRTAGIDFTRESLMGWYQREEEPPVVLPDEARPPSVAEPAMEAVTAPEEATLPMAELVEAPTEGPPPRAFRLPAPRVLVAIGVVLIVILASVVYAVLAPGGGNGDGDGDGRPRVDVSELPTFDFHLTLDEDMGEGSVHGLAPLDLVIPHTMGDALNSSVLFVNRVTVQVTWQDEPDDGLRWTNQPDTFSVVIADTSGLDSDEDSGENTQGGVGDLMVEWVPQDTWLVYGMVSLVDVSGQPVDLETSVSVEVEMVQAGDQTTRLGMTRTDGGNDVRIELVVSGTIYSLPQEGQ